MKNIILTSVLTMSIFIVNAQTPKLNYGTKGKNVIALNPGTAISNVIYPVNNNTQSEYLITYRRIFANANAIRIGVNGNSSNNNQSKSDTVYNKSNSINYKIGLGYERYFALTKVWNFYVGGDAQYGETNTKSESPLSTNYKSQKNNRTDKSLSGIIGLVVNLNSKIAISLESGFKKNYYTSTNISNQKVNGVFKDVVTVIDNAAATYVQPQLQIRFKF